MCSCQLAHELVGVQAHSLALDIDRVLSTLSPREALILRARYGLDDGKLKTLEEVGQLFEVSCSTTFPVPSRTSVSSPPLSTLVRNGLLALKGDRECMNMQDPSMRLACFLK